MIALICISESAVFDAALSLHTDERSDLTLASLLLLLLPLTAQQVADLEQQVSDLTFYIKAQAKVRGSAQRADIETGQV
jgi:hypothetical protein